MTVYGVRNSLRFRTPAKLKDDKPWGIQRDDCILLLVLLVPRTPPSAPSSLQHRAMPRIPSQQRSSTRASRQPQTGPHRSQNRPPRPQDQRPVLICRVKDEQEAILVAQVSTAVSLSSCPPLTLFSLQAAAEGRIPLAPRVPGKTARVEHGLVVVMEDPNPDKKRRYTDSGVRHFLPCRRLPGPDRLRTFFECRTGRIPDPVDPRPP